MNEIAISVKDVGKCYRVFDNNRSRLLHHFSPGYLKGMREVWALRDVSFEIKRGESVAIIGRNGGGKSTLLEILTGTLTPTTGQVVVNGRVSALLELGSGFNPEYSGRDNVILNGLLLGLTREQILSRFDEIEAFAEIGPAIDRPVKTYSSGMMVRLAFAVQVLSDPDILIIDEALSVGDFFFQQKCLSYIRELQKSGVTLLFVSHDMSTVRDLCRRGIFLRSGRLNFYGENLEAIRRYLSEGEESSDQQPPIPSSASLLDEPSTDGWLWSSSNSDDPGSAKILSVALVDENDHPTTAVRMDSDLIIRTLFVSHDGHPVDVTVAIKNRHGHLVTAVGSHTLKTPFPTILPDEPILSEIRINLALEAGDYSFSVSLARPSTSGQTGANIHESPWLGPLRIYWPYESEVPRFYGMVGPTARSVLFPVISK